MIEGSKKLVFISHATPEDNTFALWLSTKLKLMGFEVWSDVTQLFGGEKWWDDIEQAIEVFTCKFILVITKTSTSKPGVRREIELALAAEKRHGLPNFIIPVIIDESSFHDQPYGLSDRNIIAFSAGWAPALARLRERLVRDGVPAGKVVPDLGQKLMGLSSQGLRLQSQSDLVVSNWLEMISMPTHLCFYHLPSDPQSWKVLFSQTLYPWFEWGGMLVSFAESSAFEQHLPKYANISSAPRLQLQAVLDKGPRNHNGFQRGEVIKKLNYVVSDAWGRKMRALGLHRYDMASGKVAWFFPSKDGFDGLRSFADIFRVEKRKKLVGHSQKNNVHWHYAIEIKPQFGNHPRICMIPHVVFTEDGANPLSDKAKMHRLRRGFCASWWNDRWRDLLLAYLHMISNEKDQIDIPVGIDQFISFSSRPLTLETDYTLVSAEISDIEYEEGADADVAVKVDEEW